jgi:hypothetical protein
VIVMMMRRAVAPVIAALFAAGAVHANKAHEMLSGLPEGKQRHALKRTIESSGEPCGNVIRVFFQGFDSNKAAVWNAQCSNKRAYVVSVANDASGSTRVMGCAELAAITRVRCFTKL